MVAYLKTIINRNPRNLEKLFLALKPEGFELDADRNLKSFYYKVQFDQKAASVRGSVLHYKDGEVLSADAKEWPIRRHLFGPKDVCAAQNVGKVLARRCLQAGIHFIAMGYTPDDIAKSKRLKAFHQALVDGGLDTREPPVIEVLQPWEYEPVDYSRNLEDDVLPPEDKTSNAEKAKKGNAEKAKKGKKKS